MDLSEKAVGKRERTINNHRCVYIIIPIIMICAHTHTDIHQNVVHTHKCIYTYHWTYIFILSNYRLQTVYLRWNPINLYILIIIECSMLIRINNPHYIKSTFTSLSFDNCQSDSIYNDFYNIYNVCVFCFAHIVRSPMVFCFPYSVKSCACWLI